MTALTFEQTELVAPSAADSVVARDSARQLLPVLAKASGVVQLRVGNAGNASETVTIPTAAFRLLVSILT